MGSGSSGGSTTQTTTVQLTPEQRQILGYAMPQLQQFAGQPATSTIPQFSQVAPFTPAQEQGQKLALQAAPSQAGVVGQAADANKLTTSGALLDPSTNPALRNVASTIQGQTRGAVDDLLQRALPAIRSGAQLAGPMGGSRQGIAEGLAIGKAAQAVGDIGAKTTTDIALPGYLAGLEALNKGVALSPSVASDLTLPARTISGVGDVQQSMDQAQLSDYYNRLLQTNLYPMTVGQQFAGIAGALPGAGASTTATATPPKPNPLLQALGVAASVAPLIL